MRAYERLLNYVRVWTTSDHEGQEHPSTRRQFDLAERLVWELKGLGLADAVVDKHCYVYAHLEATPGCEDAPAIGFIAHMDTSPDASGEHVKPQLHKKYNGGEVVLPATGAVLSPAVFPFLREMKGQTLITTDGSTLLGADDKAGIAEIMTMLEELREKKLPHGRLCIAFTPDEEIGQGADLFDIPGFGAVGAYTVDGGDVGEIEYENFNAASAVVTVQGLSVHPGSAKNSMVNAANVAMEFHMALPQFDRPEHTEKREGFYHLTQMYGDVNTAKLGYIIRDHDKAKFEGRKQLMQHVADGLNDRYGAETVRVDVRDSYANMVEMIRPHFHLVENARKAICMAGLQPMENPIRGGTDGARLSYEGLPCPNLGTGGFNFHGPMECITVEKMDQSVEILLNIVSLYKEGI